MGNDRRASPDNGLHASRPGTEEQGQATEEGSIAPEAEPAEHPGETEAAPETTEGKEPTRQELLLMLEDARAKADEHWNGMLRAMADLDNLRKRSTREVENAHKYGLERMVTELLPVKDSLELGINAASEEGADVGKVREGVELTLKMMAAAMEKFGVQEVNPEGKRFDPDLHQAMTMQESETAEPGTVLTVIQKGYVLNDRLVRPALVVVSKNAESTRRQEGA
jgi:molecular chaperone GrpE